MTALAAAVLAVIVIVVPAPPIAGDVSPAPSYSSSRAASGVAGGGAPAVDLAGWKLTLPIGSKGKPTEVARPRADASAAGRWFGETQDHAVAFRAPVNGVTTSGSHYPRSELREMSSDGHSPASWSSTSGEHTMRVLEAFTHLPAGKSELVGAQIHDATHDITVFRLEGTNLYITNSDNPHYKLAASGYQLGTPFEAKYVVSGGKIGAYYNGAPQTTIPAPTLTGAYFKTGAYTQANCTNSSPCSDDNYGETVIDELTVSHTANPPATSPAQQPQ